MNWGYLRVRVIVDLIKNIKRDQGSDSRYQDSMKGNVKGIG
jgi:hypothetical protein